MFQIVFDINIIPKKIESRAKGRGKKFNMRHAFERKEGYCFQRDLVNWAVKPKFNATIVYKNGK